MFNIKQVLLASATFGVVATIGAMSPKFAQAAIVSGQVSGIWTFQNDGPGGYQVGDPFTALYTYNDADLVTQITNTNNVTSNSIITSSGTSNSISSISVKSTSTSAVLLSLVVNSGIVQQVFSFTPGFSFPSISWSESQFEEKLNDVVVNSSASKGTGILANTCCEANVGQYFQASKGFSQSNGIPYDYSSAVAYAQDYTNGNDIPVYLLYASTDQPVTFSATDVPTPALLPGLIGLGLGALRKRKALAAAEQAA
jgi:hypothetical protein